jgi:hypothetical protein
MLRSWVCHLPGKPRDRSTKLSPVSAGLFSASFRRVSDTATNGSAWSWVVGLPLLTWQAHDGRTNLVPLLCGAFSVAERCATHRPRLVEVAD